MRSAIAIFLNRPRTNSCAPRLTRAQSQPPVPAGVEVEARGQQQPHPGALTRERPVGREDQGEEEEEPFGTEEHRTPLPGRVPPGRAGARRTSPGVGPGCLLSTVR